MSSRTKPAAVLAAAVVLGALAGHRLAHADDASGPRIAFDEKEYLFPTAYIGTHVTHSFHFTNKGSSELVIRKVDTSCGCTVSRITRSHVPPGEQGTIELTLDTSEKMGHAVMVRGTVFTNDSKENAFGPGTTILELKGEVVSCFELRPTGAYFGQLIRSNGPKTLELRAPGVLDAREGYKILSIDVPASWLRVVPRPLAASELPRDRSGKPTSKAGYALQVTVLPTVPLGDFMGHVVVHTDCEKQPLLRFPVIGMAYGAVKGPEALLLNRFRRGDKVERLAPLERIDGTASGIPIRSLEYDHARFEIETELAIDGIRTDLRIHVKPDIAPGPFSSPIIVHLNDPLTPLVKIDVFGDVVSRVVPDPAEAILRADGKPARVLVPVEKGKLTAVAIEPADAAFEAKLQPPDETGAASVLVSPKGQAAPGTHATLVLTTDVPGEESVRVPIEVVAAP